LLLLCITEARSSYENYPFNFLSGLQRYMLRSWTAVFFYPMAYKNQTGDGLMSFSKLLSNGCDSGALSMALCDDGTDST
jgi:hypothetical protein